MAYSDTFFWLRMGDNADYNAYGGWYEAAKEIGTYLADVGESADVPIYPVRRNMGIVVEGHFEGNNYISAFEGDENAQATTPEGMSDDEMNAFIDRIREVIHYVSV